MSVSKLPHKRSYWKHYIGMPKIREVMTIDEFEAIKSNVHFNDNGTMLDRSHENFESLNKLRPLVDHLCKKKASIRLKPNLKQYNPMKSYCVKLMDLHTTLRFIKDLQII